MNKITERDIRTDLIFGLALGLIGGLYAFLLYLVSYDFYVLLAGLFVGLISGSFVFLLYLLVMFILGRVTKK